MIRRARAVLAVACGAHFIHDGFSDILYVLLPVWATEFGLSFTQVGLLKTLYTGGMASFQVPAGILAERRGEARLLVAGTAITALGFLIAGLTGSFVALLACLVVAGLGSGCQHPLSSSMVARAYETGSRRTALGTLDRAVDKPPRLRVAGEVLAQQVEVAEHRHQQIVEVVGDPASQLT